jgi:hypothetical protein
VSARCIIGLCVGFQGHEGDFEMPLDISSALSTREKRIVLTQASEECKISIYRLSVAAGVDPDILTYDWVPEEYAIEEPAQQLLIELRKLKTIAEKLSSLPSGD